MDLEGIARLVALKKPTRYT